MERNELLKRSFLPLFAVVLIFSLAGCSGCGSGVDTTDRPTTGAGGDAVDGATDRDGRAHDGTEGQGHDHGTAGDGHGHDHGDGHHTHGTADGSDPWTRTYESPQAERAGTIQNLQGLRAKLVAELERVRTRLNDGTRSDADKKADQQRAAELAQGLERLDRTILGIGEANDATWAQVRDSELKSAAEFREWMNKYGMPS